MSVYNAVPLNFLFIQKYNNNENVSQFLQKYEEAQLFSS